MPSLPSGCGRSIALLGTAGLATVALVLYLYLRTIYTHPDVSLAARQLGAAYGDAHPTVLRVDFSRTDWTPRQDVAAISIRGHFRLGSKRAETVSFTLLVQSNVVFGVSGLNGAGRAVWSHPGQITLPATL